MWFTAQAIGKAGLGTRCLGGFLAALVLFLAAMAASPTSHQNIHHDSGHAQHQCAITLFAQGIDAGVPVPTVNAIHSRSCAWTQHAPEFAHVFEPAHLRPPASGPPVA